MVVTLKFECAEYLKQWFINHCGGSYPVKLHKKSPESYVLNAFLSNKKDNHIDMTQQSTEEYMEIIIPQFHGKPPENYNHISKNGAVAFISSIMSKFDHQIWSDLKDIDFMQIQKKEAIYAWMEANGIELSEKNFTAVEKRFQRLRNRNKTRIRVKNFRKKLK